MSIEQRGQGLLQLAERCEAATGRDYELEREIGIAIGKPQRPSQFEGGWLYYTASVDAALTLVPEGFGYGLMSNPDGPGFACGVFENGAGELGGDAINLPTAALAICAAALRARTALETRKDGE